MLRNLEISKSGKVPAELVEGYRLTIFEKILCFNHIEEKSGNPYGFILSEPNFVAFLAAVDCFLDFSAGSCLIPTYVKPKMRNTTRRRKEICN